MIPPDSHNMITKQDFLFYLCQASNSSKIEQQEKIKEGISHSKDETKKTTKVVW